MPAPPPKVAGLHVQSLASSSTSCADNPCDPYCLTYDDTPDQPITTTPQVTVLSSSGGDLASSNVPSAFKSKGSLNDRCTSPCTTQSCMEACQFDQHCGTLATGAKGCVAFGSQESGSCTGVDITAPTTCIPRTGYRDVTVCNRGTAAAGPGVKCLVFPGGSPKYPDTSPSLRQASVVMTTAKTLKAGECETQEVPESAFGSNGIKSMMCNAPGSGSGGAIVETSAGTNFPSASATSSWSSPEKAYAADGVYATATSTATVIANRYPTVVANSGWTNPTQAYTADGTSASVALPASGGVSNKLPMSNTNVGWTNPTYTYAAAEANAALRYTTVALANPGFAAPVTTTARYPSSNTGNTCNNGASCTWQNAANAYAAEAPPALSASYATATISQAATQDVSSIYYGGFNFSDVPSNASITSVTMVVSWNGSQKIGAASAQAYKADGTAMTNSVSRTGNCTGSNFSEVLSSTQVYATGALTVSDLTGPKLIKLSATHCNNSSSDPINVDYVTVLITYKVPNAATSASLTLGTFGVSIPAGGVISAVNTEVKWKASAANDYVTLGVQPYTGASALGAELTTTASAITTEATQTQTLSAAVLGTLTASSVADGTFTVKLRATRTGDAGTNPDITAYVDYVKVSVTYAMPNSDALATYSGFGFSVPSGALVLGLTTEANWAVTAANPNVTLGLLPSFAGTGATELVTTSGSSPPTALTLASATTNLDASGSALTASNLADGNFALRTRATRLAGVSGDVDTTALVDYVRASVSYITTPTQTVDYSGFGFNIPESRDLMRVTASVKWKISTANSNVVLGFQAYKDGGLTALGTETTTTVGSSPPNVDTIVSADLDISNLLPLDLDSSNFMVRVRMTRGNSAVSNADLSASLDYVTLTATYGTPTGGNIVECNPYNNWSATKAVPDADPCIDNTSVGTPAFTLSRVFQATCANDRGPEWSYFAYTSATPRDSKITFRFRAFAPTNAVCVPLTAATADPPTPLAIAHSAPTDTQVCDLAGATPGCPIDLYTGLGGQLGASPACLQMDAYGVPSADGLSSPTLTNWTVRFDCLDNQ